MNDMGSWAGVLTAALAGIPAMVTTIMVFRSKQKKDIEEAQHRFVAAAKAEMDVLSLEIKKLRVRVDELQDELSINERYTRKILNVLAFKGILADVINEVGER